MTLEEAIAADRREELELAASGYEEALASGQASLGVLLNLAVLYWQTTDPSYSWRVSDDFFAHASERFPEVLEEAQRRFPNSIEPRFWQRYIAWADLNEPFSADECRELLRKDPAALTPALYLFSAVPGGEAEAEARELLRRCKEDGTTRARYVASVLDSAMNRFRRR